MAKKPDQYTSQAIEVLKGLDAVKRRAAMYTSTERPNHLAQEVIDNSVDEALAGFAQTIIVTFHRDGSLEVADDGRGMPIDIHPEEKIPGVELILTQLHAGGKFNNASYRYAGGLHGVGISVVNALSDRLIVTIKRGGKVYQMEFKNGNKVSELTVIQKIAPGITGTTVHFWPTEHYFDSPKFSISKLKAVLRSKAVLCPGLRLTFINQVNETSEEWYYEDGLRTFLIENLEGQDFIPELPFFGHYQTEEREADWAVVWLKNGTQTFFESYVNLIPTIQGGTHINGFRAGLSEAIREFCQIRNLLPRGLKLVPDDIWGCCNGILSVKFLDPQFSGQTKERLTSRLCASWVSEVIKDAFSLWLNQNTSTGEAVAQLAIENAQRRSRLNKQVERKRVVSGPTLPGKLADCINKDLHLSELFLVEGDSAGGSAKQARDRNFQAVMPLRGKILNTWEVKSEEVLGSAEIHDIAVAMGIDPGSSDLSGLRYGKICILADADSDGLHIATLLCGLFLKHFKSLVLAGHVYVAIPPLFRIDYDKEVFYALDEKDKQKILLKLQNKKKGKINIQRFKGLGEMNPIQLRETTMAPATRQLLQLLVEEESGTYSLMDMLLSKKRAMDRKSWLETKGNLAQL